MQFLITSNFESIILKMFTSSDYYPLELRVLAGNSLINYIGYPLDLVDDSKILLKED